MGIIFDAHDNGRERVKQITDEFFSELGMPEELTNRMVQALGRAADLDRVGFVAVARQALEPAFR